MSDDRIGAVGQVGDRAEAWMDAAIAANAAMREAVCPGLHASELYESAYSVYDDAGLAASAGVLFGHGIGLEIWSDPLSRGMTTRTTTCAATDDDRPSS